MARPIDQDDAIALRQPVSKSHAHVLEVGAGAMQQQDCGGVSAPKLEHVQLAARHVDKAPGRRVRAFDTANADFGVDSKHAENDRGTRNKDEDHAHGRALGLYDPGAD